MGQYFNLCSKNDKSNISCGKMMEFAYVENWNTEYFMTLLSTDWKRHRVVTAGDYSCNDDDGKAYDFPSIEVNEEDIDFGLSQRGYIYNLDTLERIDMAKYLEHAHKNEWDYIIHPLPILTESENDGGGGDYRNDDDPMIGVWANHRLFTSYRKLSRYEDITHKIYHREIRSEQDEIEYRDYRKTLKTKINVTNF